MHYGNLTSNKTFDLCDILYDLTGFNILEYDMKNKIVINKMMNELKYLIDLDCIILLVNDNECNTTQYAFQILSCYELNEKVELKEYILKEDMKKDSLYLNDTDSEFSQKKHEVILRESNNMLLKLRIFNDGIDLKTNYSQRYLLDSETSNHLNLVKELYQHKLNNYTWISLLEIFNNFTRLVILENKRFEQQINGKFTKCKREDDVVEFKSRWIYSFNVTSDNYEITIGIHQNTPNSFSNISTYLYTGLVIVKSNMTMLNFVDLISLRDVRQHYINLKLSRGSYVVIPITSGFYFSHPREPKISIDDIVLVENKKDLRTNKASFDLSIVAKNIIDEIFEKFDVDKENLITFEKFMIFFKYIAENIDQINVSNSENTPISLGISQNEDDMRLLFKNFLDDKNQMNIKSFRNYFFSLIKTKGDVK